MPGKPASRRRRTCIVHHPEDDFSFARILPDILRGNHRTASPRRPCNTGTINSGAEAATSHAVHPGMDVGRLFRQHAPALFLIQKDDCVFREPFVLGGGDGVGRIRVPQGRRVRNPLQFHIETAIEQHQETEASGLDRFSVSHPCIAGGARRRFSQ